MPCQEFNKQVCLPNMKKRNYRKSKRADQQEKTRKSIVEAAVTLHETLGPANTSIKAIAEKAGVQRLTVYRYFPDEVTLFQACSGHWFNLNQPPGISQWSNISQAEERTKTALMAFYAYYSQTENMFSSVYRDLEKVKAIQEPMEQFEQYLDQIRDDLLGCWKLRGERMKQLSLTLRHGLRFSTWLSLKKESLDDRQITELIMTWLSEGPEQV